MSEHLYVLTGASRGMGLAIARALLRPGHTVLGISRRSNSTLAAQADAAGAALLQWPMDLADAVAAADRLQAWLGEHAPERFASASLINNAGVVPSPGPLQQASASELSNALRVGLEAALLLSASFLRATDGWPGTRKILNISSGLGRRAMAGSTAYCAAKAGMDHFSRALALEQAQQPNGAKVVSLAPGVIDTDMQQQLRAADPERFPERERFMQLKAQGQLDTPEQAAAKVLARLERADFGSEPIADVRE
ncbi:SDR family NAD(P)-dependent oxidoreductase [Ideonella sp. BN130291]|uniref:SDR family NAD(P)-dependent oxidoreductase n=1 Tax=Ideonella sp. BN130291 TaxID=3112940 RepID=UPI002E253A54|nr:SDR family NAD(P)-dependent oxidoreductase [Ideonella sp. BN130291]